jgi:excisionase family DNA binding protein
MAKQMYTIAEVAALLRFSEQTIREWARSGQIKAVRPGLRAWRIPRAEVERLLAQFGIDEGASGDVASGATMDDNPNDTRRPAMQPA